MGQHRKEKKKNENFAIKVKHFWVSQFCIYGRVIWACMYVYVR